MQSPCPVCSHPETVFNSSENWRLHAVNCPRCGRFYADRNWVDDYGGRLPTSEWVWVSKRLRDAEDAGGSEPHVIVNNEFCADLRVTQARGLRPHLMALLRAIERRNEPCGTDTAPEPYLLWEARCAMASTAAFIRLAAELGQRGLVSRHEVPRQGVSFTLTAAGWDYLYDQGRLARARPPSSRCPRTTARPSSRRRTAPHWRRSASSRRPSPSTPARSGSRTTSAPASGPAPSSWRT